MSKAELADRRELKSKLINLCAFVSSDDCSEWQRPFLLDEIDAIGRILQPDASRADYVLTAPALLGCTRPMMMSA